MGDSDLQIRFFCKADFSRFSQIYGLGIWQRFFRSVRKYFSVGACIVWKQVHNFLCFIYLFFYIAFFFFFLASIRSEFLLRGVSIYILVFVNLFIYLFIWGHRGGVHFWYSCMLMACNFINNEILCAFTGLLSVGECISSKNNG